VIYFGWLFAAWAIYERFFGGAVPASVADFVRQVLRHAGRLGAHLVGCGVGFLFAAVVFILSVGVLSAASRPRRRHHRAVIVSVRAVIANPLAMACGPSSSPARC